MHPSGGCRMLFGQKAKLDTAQRLSPGVDEHPGCCDPAAKATPKNNCYNWHAVRALIVTPA